MKFICQFNPVARNVTFLNHLKTLKCNVGKKWVKTTAPLILKLSIDLRYVFIEWGLY